MTIWVVSQRQHRAGGERMPLHRSDDRRGKRKDTCEQRVDVDQVRLGSVRVRGHEIQVQPVGVELADTRRDHSFGALGRLHLVERGVDLRQPIRVEAVLVRTERQHETAPMRLSPVICRSDHLPVLPESDGAKSLPHQRSEGIRRCVRRSLHTMSRARPF
jgi:hypothetical protein